MFSKIKPYFLRKFLSNNKIQRDTSLISLQRAKTIGILCEITDEDSYKDIYSIFTSLQRDDRAVRLVGYTNGKEVPFYCLPQLTADYFSNSALNWYGKVNAESINEFTKQDFDLLIDFNYRYNTAIEYILTLSHARFIVGQTAEHRQLYDLYINHESKDYRNFLQAIDKYTTKLTGNE